MYSSGLNDDDGPDRVLDRPSISPDMRDSMRIGRSSVQCFLTIAAPPQQPMQKALRLWVTVPRNAACLSRWPNSGLGVSIDRSGSQFYQGKSRGFVLARLVR